MYGFDIISAIIGLVLIAAVSKLLEILWPYLDWRSPEQVARDYDEALDRALGIPRKKIVASRIRPNQITPVSKASPTQKLTVQEAADRLEKALESIAKSSSAQFTGISRSR